MKKQRKEWCSVRAGSLPGAGTVERDGADPAGHGPEHSTDHAPARDAAGAQYNVSGCGSDCPGSASASAERHNRSAWSAAGSPAASDRSPLHAAHYGELSEREPPFWPNPLAIYSPKDYPETRLGNAPRLDNLLRDGKIYLSLADSVALALENNLRHRDRPREPVDIADTDILRS